MQKDVHSSCILLEFRNISRLSSSNRMNLHFLDLCSINMVFQIHSYYQTPSFFKIYNNLVRISRSALSLCVFMLIFPKLSDSSTRKHHLTRHAQYPEYPDWVIPKEKFNTQSEFIDEKQHGIYSPGWISKMNYVLNEDILKSASQHNTKLKFAYDSSRDSISNPPSKLTPCPFGRESSEGRPPKDPLTLCSDL